MRFKAQIATLILILGFDTLSASTIKGVARNGTTGRPAGGDEVVLISLADRSSEAGRGKTDEKGQFEFTVTGANSSYLIQVLHEGVVYQSLTRDSVNAVAVQVFDHASALDGVAARWGIQRLQTVGDMLHVIDEITILNSSEPPRTLVDNHAFEFQLPPGAEVVAGKVQIGTEQPILRKPGPSGVKDRYRFANALLPGETRFAVAYRMPYHGEAEIAPMTVAHEEGIIIVLPETMKFEARSPGTFKPMADQPGVHMYLSVTASGTQGRPMGFRISGTGRLPESSRSLQSSQAVKSPRRGGVPSSASAGSGRFHDLRWFALGGFALVLAASACGYVSHKRRAACDG